MKPQRSPYRDPANGTNELGWHLGLKKLRVSAEMSSHHTGQKWSGLIESINMRGFASLTQSERSSLISEFERERSERVKRCRENLLAKRRDEATRIQVANEVRKADEAALLQQLEAAKLLREQRRREWMEKTKINDALKAKEKEEIRRLAEIKPLRSASIPSMPRSELSATQRVAKSGSARDTLADAKSVSVPKRRSMTPPVSTRSALAEYMKFARAARKESERDQVRYRERMVGTRYAHNVKLASTVYSRQLRI